MTKITDIQHSHGFMIKALERYRDEDKNEYIIEIYVCECGAGKSIPKNATLIEREEL